MIGKVFLCITLVLSFGGYCFAAGQAKPRWKPKQRRFDLAISAECDLLPLPRNKQLRRMVAKTIQPVRHKPGTLADRAYKFDLNGDGSPEYLVVLGYGSAFTIYDWGIFTSKPVRLIGILSGDTLYLKKPRNGYTRIHSLVHASASYFDFQDYCFKRGSYRACTKLKAIENDEDNLPRYIFNTRGNCR
ncbi:MAG: hypothetical protein HYR56_10555 [Acidobacteria bacterium]|nr:hypothetical protein [Acidobacteriota bacterium]MBI3425714.1 hypothetical protein [Acidobacteriota bacterium]